VGDVFGKSGLGDGVLGVSFRLPGKMPESVGGRV
jgi:hypothetical protein